MPVPTSISGLDTNPVNNSPQGSETVGPYANDYLQAAFAFIKQLANGSGLAPNADLNFNGKKVTNIANGSANTDAATVAQVKAVYKVGEVKMWHGAVANIATVWGAGWQLADGTNGTADLRDRFIVGAGASYGVSTIGGEATNTLTTAQLPAHNHGVNDPGHIHSINQTAHSHGVTDPGHYHDAYTDVSIGPSNMASGALVTGVSRLGSTVGKAAPLINATTGVSINSTTISISLNSATTGITTANTGSGSTVENRPPYYALCFIEYTGIGA